MKPGEEPTFYSDASSDEEDDNNATKEAGETDKKTQWILISLQKNLLKI